MRNCAKKIFTYKTLKKTEEKGYEFFDNDPFYPTGVVEGGFKWVRE